ncbi:MAG: hypothetical protein KC493_11050 [Bacteriovoracaceae bacterium]|nr:hypothetical protein [Bacteriovoracaceae bacterium]
MRKLKKVMMVLLIVNMVITNAWATVITTETGNTVEVGDGKEHGVSTGYDPNARWDDIKRDARNRYRKLREEAIRLEELHKRSNDREQRDKIADELARIQKEMDKNKADRDFEDELTRHPDRPTTRPEEGNWRRRMRRDRMDELEERQRRFEEEEEQRRARATRVSDLGNIGSATIGDASDSHRSVMDEIENQDEVQRRHDEENCNDSTNNDEVCEEIREEVQEASARVEASQSSFRRIVGVMPPIILGGGKIISLFKKLKEKQRMQQELNYLESQIRTCEINCGEFEQMATELKQELVREEIVNEQDFQELQDEERKSELNHPVDAELIVPKYLGQNTEIPFGNKDALPLAFGVYTDTEAKFFSNVKVVVDGKSIPATYYPEAGVIKALYVGFPKKHKFKGKVLLQSVDGKSFSVPFGGKVNITKPEIKITKKGGTFTRTKFKVKVNGEFDKIIVTGENIKPREFNFESVQTKKEFEVKTLSRGEAYINVKASLKTKIANVGDFDGVKIETDNTGRLENLESDLFQGAPNQKKPELGFCCEDVGALTCEGCIAGKRSRKSCKALNKLPGYNFKAFLKASDLSCSKL